MAMRVLLFVVTLLLVGHLSTGAQAQTSTSPTPSKKEISAAKKAERIANRKKRAQCYDQAKKEKVADKDIARYLDACRKK